MVTSCMYVHPRAIYEELRGLPVRVNRRILLRSGDVGDCAGLESAELFPELLALEEDRRRVSARMSSRETLRSEDTDATDVSSNSVNLEAVILILLEGGI